MTTPVTADSFADYLGIGADYPQKHLRLTDESQPGLAKELADFVSPTLCLTV